MKKYQYYSPSHYKALSKPNITTQKKTSLLQAFMLSQQVIKIEDDSFKK